MAAADLEVFRMISTSPNEMLGWTTCLSAYLLRYPPKLYPCTHCAWPESSTERGSPVAIASELVTCFGGEAFEVDLKEAEGLQWNTFKL